MSTVATTTETFAPPRLRDDLEITRQETPDGAVHLIRDPRTGRFCRFRDTEHFIAVQCDGERSAADIRDLVQQELGLDLPLETLEKFLKKLGDLHLLAGTEEAENAGADRVNGSLLHRRVRLFDPDRFLARLLGPLGFVFSETFMVLSSLAIAIAGVVAFDNSAEIGIGLARVARPGMLPLVVLAVVVVTLLHELAHGLTCKRFGGPVRDIGFLLLYFLPAFYCDVSSAWAFSEKRKRMWVTFAGIWCNLILWAIAVFTWRLTQADNWVHTLSLLILTVSGVGTLFNLIPLIKLDGYYLLSDALDAPNLRQNAFAWVGGGIKWFFGGDVEDRPRPPARLRRIYIAYGVAAGLFSTAFLMIVTFRVGGFLMSQFQALGFVSFVGMVGLVVTRPAWRRLRKSNDGAEAKPVRKRRLPWPLRMTAVIGSPIVGIAMIPWEQSVVGDVDVQAKREADVRALTEGYITEVTVREGDTVSPGGTIVRLSNPERKTEIAQIEAEIRKNSAELALLTAGAKPEQIALAQAELATAETRHDHAVRGLKAARKLHAQRLSAAAAALREAKSRFDLASAEHKKYVVAFEKGAVTASDIDRRKSEVATAKARWETAAANERAVQLDDHTELVERVAVTAKQRDEARRSLALLKSAPRSEQVTAARAEISRLKERRDYLQAAVRRETVVSPMAGTVTTRKMLALQHRRVNRGDVIAKVQQLQTVRIEMSVSEREVGNVRVGGPVDVKVLAHPGRCFRGKVVAVSPAAEPTTHDAIAGRRYIVTTLIDNTDRLLKPGMTGKAKIRCGKSTVGRVVWRKLSHYVRVEFWSWW